MPFRDDVTAAQPEHHGDPFARFLALFKRLDEGRAWLGDRVPLRLAAVTLVSAQGEPAELVARVRSTDSELGEHYGWTSSVDRSVRLVLAAALVRVGEPVSRFVDATTAGRALLREAKIRRAGVHDVLALLVLRRVIGRDPTPDDIERMRAIYQCMRDYHWFLTGPEDLTACAMLVGKSGTPQNIGDHVEAIYRRLADTPKIWAGDPLQTAANVLGLVDLAPTEAAARFVAVATALRDRGVPVRQAEYDEVAVLSFLPRSADVIAQVVAELRERIGAELSWTEKSMATSLATNLSFVRLAFDDGDARVAALGEAKLLLDMQTIVAMRQAGASV